MKRIALAIFFAAQSLPVFAFDLWSSEVFESGEVVYTSGKFEILVLGKRGAGFTHRKAPMHILIGNAVNLKVDDGEFKKFNTSQVAHNTILITSNLDDVQKIAKAKKVELQFRVCYGGIKGCEFSHTGGGETVSWEFEQPLAEQFKDYQEKIR